MKILKYNRIIQLFFISLTVALLLGSLVERSILLMVLFLQLFMGATQYVTAWIIKFTHPENYLFKAYLTIASIYMAVVVIITSIAEGFDMKSLLVIVLLFVIPWMLALFYWFVTFKDYLKRN